MRIRRLAAAAALALGVLVAAVFAGTSAAVATDPVTLGAGYVYDDVSALDAGQAQAAQARLQELSTATGVDLYVVFVDTFTNPSDRQAWADQVATQNGLGRTQYLLAVATGSRQFTISADDAGPLSNAQLEAIEAKIKPELSEGDYPGAVMVAAGGFQAELSGGTGGGANWGLLTMLLVVAAMIAIGVWMLVRLRRRRRGAVTTAAPAQSLAELAQQAGSALVRTDDAVRASEQELGFARAEFGDAQAAPFSQALAAAKTALDEAFALKQQLDDSTPDTEAQTREWNSRIIQLCAQASQTLDEKTAAFDGLRKLEQNAPAALARVRADRAAAQALVEPARQQLAALRAGFAPAAIAAVADNVDQATARLGFADEQTAAAEAALAAGQGGQAAVAIQAAQQAVAQAQTLTGAIGTLETDLKQAAAALPALVRELHADAAAASALPDPDGSIAAAVAAVHARLDQADADLAAAVHDPIGVSKGLHEANARIDAVLQAQRDAAQARARAAAQLDQLLLQAQAQVDTAEGYIAARRGAVGAQARTRLAQAGAELVRAQQLRAADPQQALAHAQRADQLAGAALQDAQGDVGTFGTTTGGSGTGQLIGAVLGGIVINSLLGGGSGGGFAGGFGGGGFSGGFGGAGGSGGGSRSRSGGGRF